MSGPWNEQRNGDGQNGPPNGRGRPSVSPLIWIALLLAALSFGWYLYHQSTPPTQPPPPPVPPSTAASLSGSGHVAVGPARG